jgi:hypothetical protein
MPKFSSERYLLERRPPPPPPRLDCTVTTGLWEYTLDPCNIQIIANPKKKLKKNTKNLENYKKHNFQDVPKQLYRHECN